MLRVRYSSPLFRLTTAEEVQNRLSFLNVGPDQQVGVIVMVLDDTAGDLDEAFAQVVVIFNTTNETITFSDSALTGQYELHPILALGADDTMREASYSDGVFSVPYLTAAVFVLPR